MSNSIIIADAGPLMAFGRLDFLPVLANTVGPIIIPESVADECTKDNRLPGAQAIQTAIHNQIITIHTAPIAQQSSQLSSLLGPGEAAAIALAIELHAGLLIDEKLTRSVARKLNLKVIGTAGILLLAKQKKLISAVLPIIQELKKTGYYLSDTLIEQIAKIASE